MSIDKLKRKSGCVYRARVQPLNGRRFSRCFKRKIDAEKFEAQYRLKPAFEINDKIRFRDYTEKFIEICAKPDLAESSVQRYQSVIRKYLNPYFGGIPLREINSVVLHEFKAEVMKYPFEQSTKYFIISALKTILRRAVEQDFLERNPANSLKVPKKSLGRMEHWSPAEVRSFLWEMRSSKRLPLYMLAFNTGARLGELVGLKWDCVDLKTETLTIRRTYCQKSKRVKNSTKTNRLRSFRMNRVLAEFLREHRMRTQGEMVLDCPAMGFSNPTHASRCFKRDTLKAGLNPIRFHDIRHTFATQFVGNSGSIHALSNILGHTSTNMTDRYAHFGSEHAAQAANIVSFSLPTEDNVLSIGHKLVTNA